jgi:hydrophobe/amphiphile efflux-1 (HAE1) family protein
MSISRLAIRRPVFAWMVMIGLILFGTITFSRLGIGYLPDVDFPVLTISTVWEGAAPEVLESEIVDRIEQAVIAVEGLTEVTSSIRQGQATLTLEFELSRPIDAALQEVQSAISRIRLPTGVDPPTLRKSNPEDQPLLWLGVYSPERSLRDIIQFVELNLKDQFEILPGVGEIILGGYAERNLRVWVNNQRLKENELTILDIREAIDRGHIETAAGIIENSQQEINVRVLGEALNTSQLADIVIATRGGRPIFGKPIRLSDVATVEDGLADIRRLSRVNGIPGIGLGIKKQRGANSVDVAQTVKKRMLELQKTLPNDVKMLVNFDSTVFVEEAIAESRFTLILSVGITALVCFLFLGSFGPTFNILLSIPTSIVGTFTFIYFLGFTLNLFTILALTLAIGIVVDDAIMVLENIYRHRAMGKSAIDSARDGGDEISFAALAATVAVIAIFLPIAFMDGVIGKFFFQFGCTLSIAVGLSLLEALTITPVRCAQFMADTEQNGRFARVLNSFFAWLARIYQYILSFSLRFRWLTLLSSIAIFALSLTVVPKLRKELIPAQDQSVFIVRFESPPGTSLTAMVEKMKLAEKYFQSQPEVVRVYTAVGGFGGGEVNTGIEFISLKPIEERSKSQQVIMNEARAHFSSYQGVKAFIQDLSTRGFTAQRGFPLEFNIRGAEWSILEQKSNEITKRLLETGLVTDVNTDYKLGQPELDLSPNRLKASELAVPIQAINDTIATAIGGVRSGKYTQDGRRYDLRIRLQTDQRDESSDVNALTIRNIHGELIPLRDLIAIKEVPTLQTITRRNRERSVTIYGNLTTGASQAMALERAQEISEEILPPGYRFTLSGGSQAFAKSFQGLTFVLWLGVIVAYMVLASQFNSFWDPVLVLLALPFSLTGAFFGLYLFDQSLNLYSVIGIVLLMGIVKKNSIMLVEFANHLRTDSSLSRREAILQASPIRLRPILMTSLATIAAALPPALALGPGAESRIPMAVTIIGGVLISTLLTLFVVPCAYSFSLGSKKA